MVVVVVRVLFIGPTSQPWETIEAEVNADLERLTRPGVELTYRCTGTGPVDIRTDADARLAAPGVVETAKLAEAEGFDGVVVDCTGDPGVVEAANLVTIPVIGPGSAMEQAIDKAEAPVVRVSGDELRLLSLDELKLRAAGAATVALGGTGWSHVAAALAAHRSDLVVLDPLAVALDACMARLAEV